MNKIEKLFHSWSHFGTAMMVSKAWEKFVVDAYRFRINCRREIPIFYHSTHTDSKDNLPSFAALGQVNICYLVHYFFPDKQGGTERFVLNLAKEQSRRGNTVRIISLGKRSQQQYAHQNGGILWTEFAFDGIPITQIRYNHAPRGLYYDAIVPDETAMHMYAKMAIERYRPDIVHLAYPQPFAAFAKICCDMSIPYVVTLTDFNIFCHYATMVSKNGTFCKGSLHGQQCMRKCKTYGVTDTIKRYENAHKLLMCSVQVTVPSAFVAHVLQSEFSNLVPMIIPHGISDAFLLREKRTQTKTFLYVGTLSPLKGVHLLIKAFLLLKGDFILKICGTGEDTYVRKLRQAAKRDSRISFSGSVPFDEISTLYQQADCVVVPSIWFETYNFVLREALACGCIGIASKIGAMPEVLEEGKNGFLFSAGNHADLLCALQKAIDFNWSIYQQKDFPCIGDECDQYQKLYERALTQPQ